MEGRDWVIVDSLDGSDEPVQRTKTKVTFEIASDSNHLLNVEQEALQPEKFRISEFANDL